MQIPQIKTIRYFMQERLTSIISSSFRVTIYVLDHAGVNSHLINWPICFKSGERATYNIDALEDAE